ncbi:sugar ABC transporter permease [Glycomyces algeriensis]|uniref:Sugar ABC transporter permease n=1 Tax=Glycomyces algeriensis TaxID=256037 RepID=A0A9W6G6R2_9ACTN|nr:sugar ABC transporter permease [Glycomyces algeriensis]MDA1366375.1 sugar ABC transporter permease [Glycomyces algeriensis]MDR7348723.1 arabinogalactan oligomer/maltooligosaccharide transport system permease protein [Glycomyces algeriensis]GLI41425.1 sugar ABC transporter permease [Glycomyces algeriensis]
MTRTPDTAAAQRPAARRRKPLFVKWAMDTGWRHVVAIAVLVFGLVPIIYVVSAAFNPNGTMSSTNLLPTSFSLNNFQKLFTDDNVPFASWFMNSLMIAIPAAFISIFISSLAAYAFSRFRFKGRRPMLLFLLLIQMFPAFLAVVALYLIFGNLGEFYPVVGLNTRLGLMLVYMGGALGVSTWLMKGFFDTIPKELDEAATIDGATHAQIFFGMILPLAAPIIAISGILAFVGTMNDFVLASLFLTDRPEMTLAVGLKTLTAENSPASYFGIFAAGTLLTSVLTVAVFMSLQRYIVSGLTGGAVKG